MGNGLRESVGSGGGNAELPPETTFDDEYPDPYDIEYLESYRLRTVGGVALELAHYSYRHAEKLGRDYFDPQNLGSVALQIDTYMQEAGETQEWQI